MDAALLARLDALLALLLVLTAPWLPQRAHAAPGAQDAAADRVGRLRPRPWP